MKYRVTSSIAIFAGASTRTGFSDDALNLPGAHRWAHCVKPGSPFEPRGYHLLFIAELPVWCREEDGAIKPRLSANEARCLAAMVVYEPE